MTDTIIVLGKKTTRKSDIAPLETFAKAMVIRTKQLITTRGEQGSVTQVIANAYQAAGGTPQFLTGANYDELTTTHPVIVFTDTKYQEQLDAVHPEWRTKNWLVIHNPKATEEAATYLTQLLADWDTPIVASP
jgi:hypothetical protein